MHDLLRLMVSKKASDLVMTVGCRTAIMINVTIAPLSNQALRPQHTADYARALMNDRQAQEFETTKECNFAISPANIGRFRVSAFMQQAHVSMV